MTNYRLISWNVNGIRAIHKKGFLDWFDNTNANDNQNNIDPNSIRSPLTIYKHKIASLSPITFASQTNIKNNRQNGEKSLHLCQ